MSLPTVIQNRGKAKRPRKKKGVFVELPLTLDEGTAKYLPYSRVSFPRLNAAGGGTQSTMQAKSELDSMWVVGMLDHQRQIQLKDGLRDIGHFLKMPEGGILPGAVEELWNVYRSKARPGSAEQRKRGIMVRDGKPLTKGEIRRVMGRASMAAKLSDADLSRLEELERGPDNNWRIQHKKTLSGTIYKKENKKLRRAIRERRPVIREQRIRSKAMETLFEIERRQVVAAIKVQRAWKKYLRLKFWKLYLLKVSAATKIQKVIRGTVLREFVRRWYKRKTFLVTLVCSIARGALTRKKWRVQKSLEYLAATFVQRIARGWMARRRRERVRKSRASENIQRVWRGVVSRARADRMWLNKQVILIQRIVRGHLGRKRHVHLVARVDTAIRLLQRVYRGMLARYIRSEKLWERETKERTALITMLRNEDEYYSSLVAEQRKKVAMGNYEAKARRARQDLDKARDHVYGCEFDYLGFVDERRAVSPRAIRQGFTDALEDNVEDWRKRVTRAKVMCLFDSELTLRKIQEEELKEKTKLEDIEYKFQTIQEERQWAMTSLWRRNSERKWQEETRAKQVRVASQKRKWRINFFTKTGKPDKQRRAGHPWSKEAFADESHESFFLGGADLLLGRKGESPGRLGSQKALQTALAAVHLQSTQNTMVQYGSLLKPLFSQMEETEADLIVNGGFPKTFMPIPEMVDGSSGPVLEPKVEQGRQFAAEQGSPLRATASERMNAETALSLVVRSESNSSGTENKSAPKKGAARKVYTTRIPWNLLDQLEAEKHALQTEQVNRLAFERKDRAGIDNSNPLVLDPKKAKSFKKKKPVHPEWPKNRKANASLRSDNEGVF